MNYKVIVSPIASKNIEDAVAYYIEKATKKVAFDFLKAFKKIYKKLYKSTLFTNFTITIIGLYLLIHFLISPFLLWTNPVKVFTSTQYFILHKILISTLHFNRKKPATPVRFSKRCRYFSICL